MEKTGRNDRCPCGSGRKYKSCCLPKETVQTASARPEATSIPKALQIAVEHHRSGRLSQAEAIYQEILRVDPGNADALHLSGCIAHQCGSTELAIQRIRRAIAAKPFEPSYHNSLGIALQDQGRADEAIGAYRQALLLKVDHAEAHNNLGILLHSQGRVHEATQSYQQAIVAKPDYAEAHNNLGVALQAQGKLDEATKAYRQALAIKPDYAQAHNNVAVALQSLGRMDDANLACRQAIALSPEYADAHYNLGNVLRAQGRLNEALGSYGHALRIRPDYAKAHNNLGNTLRDLGRLNEAAASYRQALASKPDYAEAFSNLLFCLTHDEHLTPEDCAAEHFAFARRFEDPLREHWRAHSNDRSAQRRLRVGFVSGDLRKHAVAHFIEPLWAALAPEAIELWAYAAHPLEDAVTARLRQRVPHWRRVAGLSDDELAETIRTDGIDILIDLSGHTAHNRLLTFARKPAPVQATWIGYPGTTGLTAIDYVICDRFTAPEGAYERYYSEHFARLPSSGPFRPGEAPEVNALPALSNGFVTFASFNRPGKLGEKVVEAWSLVLRALPDARLLLGDVSDEALAQDLTARFGRHGIAPERIRFQPAVPIDAYLALHHGVDILLDTWPYAGGTTTNHALWMGVPVVTMRGPSRAHCQGAGVMGRMQLEDWIADDVAGFVRIAVEKARDIEALAALRQGMRERWTNSPWRQSRALASGLEAALREMWRRWCLGLPAAHFEIPPAAIQAAVTEA